MRIGMLDFIDIPILSFLCGLVVPVFGWKKIMVIRLGLVSLSLITQPYLLLSSYEILRSGEGIHGIDLTQFFMLLVSLLYVQAFGLVLWFYKRYKKWVIF